MKSCNCNTTENTPIKDYIIQQMSKVVREGDADKKVSIFLPTLLQTVYDVCSGDSLDLILRRFNNHFVVYNKSFKKIVSQIPNYIRRKGLIITYTNNVGIIKNLQYNGNTTSTQEWEDELNWVSLQSNNIPDLSDIEDALSKIDLNAIKKFIEENKLLKSEVNLLKDKVSNLESIKEKYVVRLEKLETDTQVGFRYYYNDGDYFDYLEEKSDTPPITPPSPKPVETFKVYFGYRETINEGEYIRQEDLKEFREFKTLPVELHFGESKEDVFGYWGIAIDKRLLPNGITSMEMEAIGQFMPMEGGYIIDTITIDNQEYWFIKDSDLEEINPIGLRIQ